MNQFPHLTVMTLVPILGALIIALLPGRDAAPQASVNPWPRRLGILTSLISLLLAIFLWVRFDSGNPQLQFEERYAWMPSLGVQYFVGVDGLGLVMVALTALVVPFALFAAGRELTNSRAFVSLMLLLEAGLFGAFTALNFVHWFIFWELSLVPAYFLIKLWGGPNRTAAATQFFIYTLVGSVTMLLGFMAIFLGTDTFDFFELAQRVRAAEGGLEAFFLAKLGAVAEPRTLAALVFVAIGLGFAVKVPLFPFHTWLPNTYAEAPTTVTMVLTGVMSKMGVYGLLRILLPLFPEQMRVMLTPLLWLAVATIVFSAFAAFAQRDLKRIFAYSSINHLGYCLLGIFAAAKATLDQPVWIEQQAAALNGVVLQMFNHGITAAALFCFIALLERRAPTAIGGASSAAKSRSIGVEPQTSSPLLLDDFGGLRKVAPIFCGLMGISVFASLGLPGLNGFTGEFLIFKGAFALASWPTLVSALGLLITAVFLLTLMQRVFHGPLNPAWSGFRDLTTAERCLLAPAIALMFLIGIYPQALLHVINPSIMQLISQLTN
jgi:NADH-quinone oxidoreductase subunit M